MKPLHFGAKSAPRIKLQAMNDSSLIVSGIGPRLDLDAVFDRMFITSADEGNEESGKMDGIHIPQTSQMTMKAYAVVTVLKAGPDVKQVKVGDRILIVRAQASKIGHDGQIYWFTTEQAVLGIVK